MRKDFLEEAMLFEISEHRFQFANMQVKWWFGSGVEA